MHGSDLRFYADTSDLAELFSAFNRAGEFSYTQTLSEANKPLLTLKSADGLMRYLRTGHPQASNVFLIMDQASKLNTQSIILSDGSGTKCKADQPCNPDAVLIKLGGQLDEKRVLIATSINTTGETPRAKAVFKLLKKNTSAIARYVGGFYVLPGAFEKLNAGWRLTPDPGFSLNLDLKNE